MIKPDKPDRQVAAAAKDPRVVKTVIGVPPEAAAAFDRVAAGCTCSGYYVDGRMVTDTTRCPIHSERVD